MWSFLLTQRAPLLQLVVLPVIDQFLARLQLIRAAQEQQQWERYAAAPPEEAGPSSGG